MYTSELSKPKLCSKMVVVDVGSIEVKTAAAKKRTMGRMILKT
jgi:hypothetical protein